MKFVEVIEDFETYVADRGSTIIKVKGHINLDNIELIRTSNNNLLVFLIGRDKALKISDKESVDKILKECKISKTLINE